MISSRPEPVVLSQTEAGPRRALFPSSVASNQVRLLQTLSLSIFDLITKMELNYAICVKPFLPPIHIRNTMDPSASYPFQEGILKPRGAHWRHVHRDLSKHAIFLRAMTDHFFCRQLFNHFTIRRSKKYGKKTPAAGARSLLRLLDSSEH